MQLHDISLQDITCNYMSLHRGGFADGHAGSGQSSALPPSTRRGRAVTVGPGGTGRSCFEASCHDPRSTGAADVTQTRRPQLAGPGPLALVGRVLQFRKGMKRIL